MEDMIWKASTEGVPMHLGHDMHRLIGIMIPFGLYFEPNLTRNIGLKLIPENEEERQSVVNFKKYNTYKNIKETIRKNENKLYNLIKKYLTSDFKYHEPGTLAIVDNNIVDRVFENLKKLEDKDGLIDLNDLYKEFHYKYQGVFFHNDLPLCIFSNSFFRRSLSRQNNYRYIFLDELMSLDKNENVQVRISLDWDMIGYAPTYLESMEFEYWFGPEYNDDISSIKSGLSKHVSDEFERSYYGISSTEFFWKKNKNLKEFELEELKENDAPTMEGYFGCRYIHSIYDTSKSIFVHFDGAIRRYDTELYFERIESKMTDFGRRSEYKKLFRVDGELPLNSWKSLITNYMQDNPLIYEYFDEIKPERQSTNYMDNKSLMEELVPNSLSKDDGIRLLVSYHNENLDYREHSRAISIYDIINDGNTDRRILEDEIFEVKKALNRLGCDLYIEDNVLFGNIKDEYWNIPCIFHSSPKPENDISTTLSALKMIFQKMVDRNLETITSFTISWNMDGKEVRVSCLGHIHHLLQWLNSIKIIPIDRTNFIKWLEEQRTYLKSNFNEIFNKPLLEDICQHDGVLYIKRKVVDPSFELNTYEENGTLNCTVKISKEDEQKYKDILNGTIQPVMAYVVNSSKCSKTNDNYYLSSYSKLLDDDVHQIIEDIECLSFYWSDNPIN